MSKSTYGRRKAGLASLATTALVAGACVAGAGAASATSDFSFHRYNGADRYATSALVDDAYGKTTTAILANGEPGQYADALAANYLSGVKNAPILLTQKDATPDAVKKQLADAGVKDIFVVGGSSKVSDAQVSALETAGYNVTRVSGTDRFQTDAKVIGLGDQADENLAVVATGFDFPDALSGGPLAYDGRPLALTSKTSMDQDVIDALKAAGITKAVILGGTSKVGPEVEAQLAANGITVVKRLSGSGRAETSVAVANYALDTLGFSNTGVGVASGYTKGYGADALTGGPLEGKANQPLLITTDVNNPSAAVLGYLKDHANTLATGDLFGGKSAVSVAAQDAMVKAARTVTSNQTYSVTPSDSATFGATNDDKSARSYTVSGLDDSKTYNIALFPAKNVTVDGNGVVKFADAEDANSDGVKEGDDVADYTATGATVTKVNNQTLATTDTNGIVVDAQPVNGVLKFTINSDAPADVVPVVYLDADNGADDANSKPDLDLNKDNTPSESFAIGGETVYTPQAASAGAVATRDVLSNDEAANTFVAQTSGQPSTARTYSYDSNDTFYSQTPDAQHPEYQMTMAEFEKALTAGDTISSTYYQSSPELSTQWVLTDQAPTQPQSAAAAPTKGAENSSVTVTWTAPAKGNPDTYNVYRAKGAAGTVAYTTDGDFTKVGSVDGDTLKFVDSGLAASQTYTYVVTAVEQGDESDASNEAEATTLDKVQTDQDRPVSNDAVVTKNSGLSGTFDAGDVFKVVFSEPMAAPTAGDTIRANDNDGTVGDFANGTNATFTLNSEAETVNGVSRAAGTVLTVTVTSVPTIVTAGNTVGLQIPAVVTDQSGNTDVAGNTWNVTASPDATLDQDADDNNATPNTVPAQAASVSPQGGNYTVTANEAGPDGNAITYAVEQSAPSDGAAPLSVAVNGSDIVVTLGNDGTSPLAATTAQVVALINNDADASALVTGDGGDATTATTYGPANLSGGTDPVYP